MDLNEDDSGSVMSGSDSGLSSEVGAADERPGRPECPVVSSLCMGVGSFEQAVLQDKFSPPLSLSLLLYFLRFLPLSFFRGFLVIYFTGLGGIAGSSCDVHVELEEDKRGNVRSMRRVARYKRRRNRFPDFRVFGHKRRCCQRRGRPRKIV